MKRCLLAILLLLPSLGFSQTLFEGYFRIEKDGRHQGYAVQRVTFDKKSKTRVMTTYVRVREDADSEIYQSFKSVAREGDFAPVSSWHESDSLGQGLRTWASFAKDRVTVRKKLSTARVPNTEVLPAASKKPFRQMSFLYMFTNLAALKPNTTYIYHAYAEHRGWLATGELTLADTREFGGQKVFHLVEDVLGEPVESFVNADGFPLGSRSPVSNWVTYWVPKREDAVGEMNYPTGEMTKLFGDLPLNKKNPWSALASFKSRDAIQSFQRNKGRRGLSSEKEKLPVPLRLAKAGAR